MKKNNFKKFFLALTLSLAMLSSSVTAVYAEGTPQATNSFNYTTYFVANCQQSITLRPGADVNSGEICQIPLGAPVSYIEGAPNGFYKVVYNGTTGYALASYLSLTPPTNITYQPPQPVYATYYVVNCKQSITLRPAPDVNSGEICQIPLGAAVSFISTSDNGFYKIIYNGLTGYSLASYLSSVPQTYYYEGCYYDPFYDLYQVVNCNQSITLRPAPDVNSGEICQIPLGAYVIFYSDAGNGFHYVEYNGYTGYALSSYLTPLSGLGYDSTCVVVNCNESITLRPGPYVESGEICQIPLGSPVTFVSDAGNGFYEIYYLGNHGYAMASYLAFQ